jgi:hypothetical protein
MRRTVYMFNVGSLNDTIDELNIGMDVIHRANESLVEKSCIKDRYIEQLKIEKEELKLKIDRLTENFEKERKELRVSSSIEKSSSIVNNVNVNIGRISLSNKSLQELSSLKKHSLNSSLYSSTDGKVVINPFVHKDTKQLDLKKR